MTTVELILFCDDASGDYGFTHCNTQEKYDTSFNAFYTSEGIFHDVFEHEHEYSKYFRGSYAMNVGGEIAAMGSLCYIYQLTGRSIRFRRPNIFYPEQSIAAGAYTELLEMLSGYSQYGSELLCNVPYQKPIDDNILYEVEEQILNHLDKYKKSCIDWLKNGVNNPITAYNEIRKTITRSKIQRLLRWGYRKAKRKIKDNNELLYSFSNFFDNFCKVFDAEDLFNWGLQRMIIKYNSKKWFGYLIMSTGDKIYFNSNTSLSKLENKMLKLEDYY